MNLQVDGERLRQELDDLGYISSEPAPVVTRVVFTHADMRARNFLRALPLLTNRHRSTDSFRLGCRSAHRGPGSLVVAWA